MTAHAIPEISGAARGIPQHPADVSQTTAPASPQSASSEPASPPTAPAAHEGLGSRPAPPVNHGTETFGDIDIEYDSKQDGDRATASVYKPGEQNRIAGEELATVHYDLETDSVQVRDGNTGDWYEFQARDGAIVQTQGPPAKFITNQHFDEGSPGNLNFPADGQQFVQVQIANPDAPPLRSGERATDSGGVGIQIGLDSADRSGGELDSLKTVIYTKDEQAQSAYPDFQQFSMQPDFLGDDPDRILMDGADKSFTTPTPEKVDTFVWYNPTTWTDNSNPRWYVPTSWGWFDGQ